MFWGQTRSLLLLLIIHGVCCDDTSCSKELCQCGESVTMTCKLNEKLVKISIKNHEKTVLENDLPTKEKLILEDGKISIEWTEVKVMVTISEVTFSDIHKYVLFLETDKGFHSQYIDFKVSGICEPKISKTNETKELVCEAESENNSSIIWRNNHRYVHKMTRANKELSQGYELKSSLTLTEDFDGDICCAVSDGGKEKESCYDTTSAIQSPLKSKNSTFSIVIVLLIVALVAVAFVYLIKRRKRIVDRDRHLSQAYLVRQEIPEKENGNIPPLLTPESA
ncbi:uncharacterized protein ACNLHF_018349 isoform 2-T4 [Anomaloglossus baeobatrachus]|uniref:uncharacterized protein LOC142310358 isoform X2 n=1 Tax=Anomaloglossus baeobatrachus TaxID=238106 RepID=UPI003F4F7C04